MTDRISRLALAMATAFTAVVGCGSPSIGDEPYSDIPLPERDPGSSSGDPNADGGTTIPTTSGPSNDVVLSVALNGAGDVTSTPPGLSCSGTTCTGTFKRGTSVTLAAAPKLGSLFAGWTGGCTGDACAPVLDADTTAVTAQFPMLDGAWTGTYTNTRQNVGCTFNNAGNLDVTFTSAATISTSATCTGLQIRSPSQNCAVVDTRNGTAAASDATATGVKVTGTWPMAVAGIGGTLAFPFVGTLDGNKLTGNWSCPTCTGSFTLTKKP